MALGLFCCRSRRSYPCSGCDLKSDCRRFGSARQKDARAKLAVILTKHGVKTPLQYPDISSAEKAWKVIGVDIEKNVRINKNSSKEIVPQWEKLKEKA